MGQGYSINTLSVGPSAIETTELSDLTFEKSLGGGRFLRTVRARHQHGIVVVKVASKPNPGVSLKKYRTALLAERTALRSVPNVLPYQKIRETGTVGVLVRQFVHSSLYDRVSMRPFLESIEKKWITFQLLYAVRDCHARGVFHGDIKSENVMVTSWGWAYLTDFASTFKPVYLPEDNPADFTYYYDTSTRRTCYLAPERFLVAGEMPLDHTVQWNMDIFSLGCVIAELFTETPTFSLSQLFKYRKGEYDPTVALLNKLDDEHVRALVSSMIRLDPSERWHAQDYLDEYKNKAFPLYFYQHLHTLMQEITDPSSGRAPVTSGETNNGESDARIDRVYNDFEMLSVSLGYERVAPSQSTRWPGTGQGLFPMQVDLPNTRHLISSSLEKKGDQGTFILLNVITASIRNVARASSKVRACELFLAFAERLPDEAKLDRILPYVMPLLEDPSDMVLVAALRTMTQLLALVTVTSPVNSSLFTQYIFPRLQVFVKTNQFRSSRVVRATYASCLASLAESALRFLDMMQALRANGSLPTARGDDDPDERIAYPDAYDVTRLEVLDQFEAQTKVFLTDSDTAVRRAFLSSVPSLCVMFGETRASDVILSHLNTYLNDPDWLLKCAFFRTMVGVAVFIGGASLEEFILPLVLQALTDPQEFVVEQALRSLASMAEMGLLQRDNTWELIDTVAKFQMHPNMWIKEAASHFVSAATTTTYLSIADVRILVAPLLKPYLKIPISKATGIALLDSLKKPVPRAVLEIALQWAAKGKQSAFWKQVPDSRILSSPLPGRIPPVSSVADLGPKSLAKAPKTDDDERWLVRLRNAGMRGEDEIKVMALREYLWRAGQRTNREEVAEDAAKYERLIKVEDHNIAKQKVLFNLDVGLYHQRAQGQDGRTNLTEAIQEATKSSEMDSAQSGQTPERHGGARPTRIPGSRKTDGPLRLPELQQHSGSGQSLSSSPSSVMGPTGGKKPRRNSNVAGLLSGADLKAKSSPQVATDESSAEGRVDVGQPADLVSTIPHAGKPDVANDTKVHDYAGKDPSVLKLLSAVYIDKLPLDAAEFGPLIKPMKKGPIPTNNGQTDPAALWRPKGQLVAVLGEHTSRVNRIAVAPDHSFFVTGGEDGFVRVWDAWRMERNISHRSKSRQSLGDGVSVTSLSFVDSTHTFVCTGSDGTVHFMKVPVGEKGNDGGRRLGSIQLSRSWNIPAPPRSGEYAVWSEHIRGQTSTLFLATNLGRVLALDLRSMTVRFELQNPVQHGVPTSFAIGRRHDWILIGTSHGVLDLWDLRFHLRLRGWIFPAAAPVTRVQLHPSRKSAKRSRVCVSGGTARGEVSVWDIEKPSCHEIYRPAHTYSKARLHEQDYRLRNLDDEQPEGILSRVAGSVVDDPALSPAGSAAPTLSMPMVFGMQLASAKPDTQHAFLVTGGPDGKVRFWDGERLEACTVVNGGDANEKTAYTVHALGSDTRVVGEKPGERPSEAQAPAANAKGSLTRHTPEKHLDTITDVAVLEKPFGMILSADRSGKVLVYQ